MPKTIFRFTPSAEGVRVVRTELTHVAPPPVDAAAGPSASSSHDTAGAPAPSVSASTTLSDRHEAEYSLLEDALRSARVALGYYPDCSPVSELALRPEIEDVTDERPLRLHSSQLPRAEEPLVAEASVDDEEEEPFCMPSLVQHAPTTPLSSSPAAGDGLFANATSGAAAGSAARATADAAPTDAAPTDAGAVVEWHALLSASVAEAFRLIDRDGDGVVSGREMTLACRREPHLRQLLGLPPVLSHEDGSLEAFEAFFEALDAEGTQTLTHAQFQDVFHFGRL